MTVWDLICALQKMPMDAQVKLDSPDGYGVHETRELEVFKFNEELVLIAEAERVAG